MLFISGEAQRLQHKMLQDSDTVDLIDTCRSAMNKQRLIYTGGISTADSLHPMH